MPDRVTYFVSFVDELVGACDELQTVYVVKLRRHLVAKQPTRASRADSPCFYVFGVGPYQVAKGALVGNLLRTGDHTNLIYRSDLRT